MIITDERLKTRNYIGWQGGPSAFTGEEVLQLLDADGEDGGLDFPGSDDELGFLEDDERHAIK